MHDSSRKFLYSGRVYVVAQFFSSILMLFILIAISSVDDIFEDSNFSHMYNSRVNYFVGVVLLCVALFFFDVCVSNDV